VKKDAAAGDIKKAYYQLAKKWHPDTNKDEGANERFVEIQTAYDVSLAPTLGISRVAEASNGIREEPQLSMHAETIDPLRRQEAASV
jgi:preprotein translocase subunit Sec63